MKRWLSFVALALAACSDDFSIKDGGDARADEHIDAAPIGDVNPPLDAATDAAPNDANAFVCSGDANAPVEGAAACNQVMDAYCIRNNCGSDAGPAQCRVYWNQNYPTYDCSTAKYKKQICSDDANKCIALIESLTCQMAMKLPVQLGPACAAFFGDF